MPETRVRKDYRLPPRVVEMIGECGEAKEGLTATQVVENAVREYHRRIFGRRSADMTPIKTTPRRNPNAKG